MIFTIGAFWFHSPPIRDQWLWLLWFAPLIWGVRWSIFERVWIKTPLTYWLIAFIILSIFNFAYAPLSRNSYLIVMSRPLLGVWIYLHCIEHARVLGHLRWLIVATLIASLFIASVALMTTEWDIDKAPELEGIIEALPRLDWRTSPTILGDMLLGFNPNEIAGALTFIVPFLAALAFMQHPQGWLTLRIVSGVAFALAFCTLFLSQSRFGLAGVLLALALLTLKGISEKRWRVFVFVLVALVILAEGLLMFGNPLSSQNAKQENTQEEITNSPDPFTISERDQQTLSIRIELWKSAFQMVQAYPLTGVGMSMFRSAVQQEPFTIPSYGGSPPHAHNEWFQIATDLGLPGFGVFLMWHISILRMLWHGWNTKQQKNRIIAAGVCVSLVAHLVFGVGDTIALWDRFSFLFWWMAGLAGAQYIIVQESAKSIPHIAK